METIPAPSQTLDRVTVPSCANCGTPRAGAFCHECGQQFSEERLRILPLVHQTISQFLLLDRGFLRTAWDLTVRPGPAIDR